MQITRQTETAGVNAFLKKLEDHPGGITVAVSELGGSVVYAGTVVGKDANGLFHVIKTLVLYAAATNVATTYQVKKGHHAKVGDFFGIINDAAYAISAIDTSNASYDVITLGTTLGVALNAGDVLTQANAAVADNAVLKYSAYGLTGNDFDITSGDNHTVDCIVRGTAIESNIPGIHATVKAMLTFFRFV